MKQTTISDTIYNVIFSKHEMIGGSNGTNKIKPLTINIEEKLYTLNDFIEDLDFNKETLSQIIFSVQLSVAYLLYIYHKN